MTWVHCLGRDGFLSLLSENPLDLTSVSLVILWRKYWTWEGFLKKHFICLDFIPEIVLFCFLLSKSVPLFVKWVGVRGCELTAGNDPL